MDHLQDQLRFFGSVLCYLLCRASGVKAKATERRELQIESRSCEMIHQYTVVVARHYETNPT